MLRFNGQEHFLGNEAIKNVDQIAECVFAELDEQIPWSSVDANHSILLDMSHDNSDRIVVGSIDGAHFELDFGDFVWHVVPKSIGEESREQWRHGLGDQAHKDDELIDYIFDVLNESEFERRLSSALDNDETSESMLEWIVEYLMSGITSRLVNNHSEGFASQLYSLVASGLIPVGYSGEYPFGEFLVLVLDH